MTHAISSSVEEEIWAELYQLFPFQSTLKMHWFYGQLRDQ